MTSMTRTEAINHLVEEIDSRFGEYLNSSGPGKKPELYGIVVTKMLLDERDKVEYLQKRLKEYERRTSHR